MQVHFLLGPAGSGKTFRCLTEVRQILRSAPDGPPLILIAPKQTTYQIERQLLAEPDVAGYTRLHILSFERLAHFAFARLHQAPPRMLDEEGRLMVLRGLLAKKRKSLKLFRASARLTGFARQLSLVLAEFQRHGLAPASLTALAATIKGNDALGFKLQDLALLLQDYLDWLERHQLQDNERLLAAAAGLLSADAKGHQAFHVGQIWVDGFAQLDPQEIELLTSLVAHCDKATLTFCLDQIPAVKGSWLSPWSTVLKTFEECSKRLGEVTGASTTIELLERNPLHSRFQKKTILAHLERFWADAQPRVSEADFPADALRVATCVDPDAEAILAAREILAYIRAGGRYRDISVLVRQLDAYHQSLQGVFTRYEIPFFLDRRESVSHHPLAELTRSALRTVAYQWKHEDWFAALKTGLVCVHEREIDQLENEALARGWKGAVWHQPINIKDATGSENETKRLRSLEVALERIRGEIVPPFQRFELALAAQRHRPTGPQLAAAIRAFWTSLDVETRLEEWAAAPALGRGAAIPSSVHATVWDQMNAWLRNVELAFSDEAVPLREWLPILEAGLANLTVGVIPPALDQVLIGAIDRSRNSEVKLALILGLNEAVFPASPSAPALLTEADHHELEKHGVQLTATARAQLSRERFYAYLAFTRASGRLVLTNSLQAADSSGSRLNPSPFLSHLGELFPKLEIESVPAAMDWRETQHAGELIVPLLRLQKPGAGTSRLPPGLRELPVIASVIEQLRHFDQPPSADAISPALASRLYGPVLRTSVSRMEQFAACPFRFFVHSGLRAEERKQFELDAREQGSFQHDALAAFHDQLHEEKKRWRDITPTEARQRVGRIAEILTANYRDGLLQANEQSRFLARVLSESLQDFVETLVGWMRRQYQLDPELVELPFGTTGHAPPWELDLGGNQRLALRGRIDRIDLHKQPEGDSAVCVVVDYKSSQKKLDPLLVANGLQLQLLAYLNVLCQWPQAKETFGVSRLIPAGVFYVNLRGGQQPAANRREALAVAEEVKASAYRHTGRFDAAALRLLDARPEATAGDQFNYRRKLNGELNKTSREAMATQDFELLLTSVAQILQEMGRRIYSGVVKVDPYRKGSTLACDFCDYQSICRIDPWTHKYRSLSAANEPTEEPAE